LPRVRHGAARRHGPVAGREHVGGLRAALRLLPLPAALVAETKRTPFDQPQGASEIVSGYFLEYSGMKFGLFFIGGYIALFVSSALLVTLFFGGYQIPFLHHDGITVSFGDTKVYEYKMIHGAVVGISALSFFLKTMIMAFVQIFFRWTLPRFRYDQVM